jgi:hypothetical protein
VADQRPPTYVSGLDLGQASDFTALAVLEKWVSPDPTPTGKHVAHYDVRHLERFQLGSSYGVITERLVQLFAEPPLKRSVLAVDRTGVGRAVVGMIQDARPAASLLPITITAGHRADRDENAGGWRVPKKDLVGVLQVLLQERRIKVAPRLPEAQTLVKELQNFRVKVTTAANEIYEAWREGQHDDLVLAVGIAAWAAERSSGTGGWLVPRQAEYDPTEGPFNPYRNFRSQPFMGVGSW